jgi:hypothetical protein
MPATKIKNCSRCGHSNDRPAQRYCTACHTIYMRQWRETHPLLGGQRDRDISRSKAGVAKRRGQIAPQPCEACGDGHAEMHHQDHERPLEVTWLCRPCHLAWHSFWREISRLTFVFWMTAGRQVPAIVNRETSEAA